MRLSKDNSVRLAGNLLDALLNRHKAYPGTWRSTSDLTKLDLNLPVSQQSAVRRVLTSLLRKGKLKYRNAGSKHYWMINVIEWSERRPFDSPYPEDLIDSEYYTNGEYLVGDQSNSDEEGEDQSSKDNEAPSPKKKGKPAVRYEQSDDDDDDDYKTEAYDDSELRRRVKELEVQVDRLEATNKDSSEQIKVLNDTLAKQGQFCKTLEVRHYKEKTVTLKNVVLPSEFQRVLDLAKNRLPILLVGPAGCGKTHMAELIARTLDFDFDALNLSSGISEHHLVGKNIPNLTTGKDKYHPSMFVERYEKGGVFLADELDAADPNVLMCLNSGLSNGTLNIPRQGSPKAKQHANFILIATANTFGRGANRVYAGRNQLDEATLDRFRMGTVECDYDPTVELMLCPDEKLRTMITNIRQKVIEHGLRRVVSSRFMANAYAMKKNCQWDDEKIMSSLLSG